MGIVTFAELLRHAMDECGVGADRLAKAAGVPKQTIIGWRNGRRPQAWEDVLKVARGLMLDAMQADHLLEAARHPTLTQLARLEYGDAAQAVLMPWLEELHQQQLARPEREVLPPTVLPQQDAMVTFGGSGSQSKPWIAPPRILGMLSVACLLLVGMGAYLTPPAFITRLLSRDAGIPGGEWVSPGHHFVVTTDRLHFVAHAHDNPGGSGIDHVNFTALIGDTWQIACTATSPSHDDVFECDWHLTSIPNGALTVSFDVYDRAKNYNRAPHGLREGQLKR